MIKYKVDFYNLGFAWLYSIIQIYMCVLNTTSHSIGIQGKQYH